MSNSIYCTQCGKKQTWKRFFCRCIKCKQRAYWRVKVRDD